MLDKRTAATLFVINGECADGAYKVIEAEELIAKLPSKLATEADGLKQTLKYLKEREYIDIKYSDNDVYCLFPLPKGRLYFENENAKTAEAHTHFRQFLFTAFLGAMAGAIIGSIITALVVRFLL